MIKVSVLIPVYNVEQYMLRCLESVACQTYQGDIECIIVDDCGKDASMRIAEEFIATQNSHVKFLIVRHTLNRGLAAARNTGIEQSTGDFVMHLDSDDWLEPNAIDLLVQKQHASNADIVSGNALAHYENSVRLLSEPDYVDNMDMVFRTIQLTMDHVIWRRLIRKSLYTDNDIKAEEGVNIGEDHHTLPRLAYFAKTIEKADTIIYHYNCVNPNSYMQSAKQRINLTRYNNDCRSIQILRDFFADRVPSIIEKLDLIERNYKVSTKKKAIVLGDHEQYIYLSKTQGVTPHYFSARMRFMLATSLYRIKYRINTLFARINNDSTQ